MKGEFNHRNKMIAFLKLFSIVLVAIGIPLTVLALINKVRKKQPGCSGSHDCVVYKGEKVQCPSCELREYQTAQQAEKGLKPGAEPPRKAENIS